jgi:hypothetical protein
VEPDATAALRDGQGQRSVFFGWLRSSLWSTADMAERFSRLIGCSSPRLSVADRSRAVRSPGSKLPVAFCLWCAPLPLRGFAHSAGACRRAGRHVPLPPARGAGELAVRFATHRLRAAGARGASSIRASPLRPSAFHVATPSSTDGTRRQPTVPSPHTPSLSRISATARSSGHRGHASTGQVAQVALARGPDADRVCGIGVTTRSGRSCARFRWSSRHRRSPAS